MNVSNTAVVGGGPDPETADLYVIAGGTAVGVLNVSYSFFRDAHALTGMGGGTETLTRGAGNIDGADAKLYDIAHGDLRPEWDSPLVDHGDPVPGGGEPMADLAGNDRTANGVTDIGAYEYGHHAPTLSVEATPAAVITGEAVTFKAATTDLDGESPDVTWVFDDGTTAVGLRPTHAFSTPGAHTATATATDPAGLTATAIAAVTVSAPVLPLKVFPPGFGFKKLKAHGGVVRVLMSCPVFGKACVGTLRLQLAGRKKIVLGTARFRIPHGTKKAVKVRLGTSARRRLHRARHGLRVKVVAKPKGAAAKSKTVRLTGR
jgi:PKD repeat protein